MLTSKQRAFLRKEAHNLDAVVRVGKDGCTDALIQSILDAIPSRELMKIKVLQNCEGAVSDLATEISEKAQGEIVGVVGRTIIFYKENKDKPTISLDVRKVK